MTLSIYRQDGTGVIEATDHPLYNILHDSPNAYMNAMELLQSMVMGYCLRGNGYAVKAMMGSRVVGLNLLRADWMIPKWDYTNKEWVYEFHNFPTGGVTTYQSEELIHIKNFSIDGMIGLSPLTVHAIQHAQITDSYSANFLRNQARPAMVLESDKPKPKQNDYTDRLSEDWNRLYSRENAGKTAVLWDGMKAHPITISPDDAQYIETRKLNASDITGIYGVPANMLGHTDKTATYASAEQFDIQFAKHCIRPLARLIEKTFNKALFAKEPGTFCAFDLSELQEGDSKAKSEYYGSMVEKGIMTRNEARKKLKLPTISYADKLTVQANMVDLDKLADLSASATPALVQGDIRKSASPSSVPENHIHVVTPMAEEQMEKTAQKLIGAALTPRKKTVRLIKLQDGTTTGATITEE